MKSQFDHLENNLKTKPSIFGFNNNSSFNNYELFDRFDNDISIFFEKLNKEYPKSIEVLSKNSDLSFLEKITLIFDLLKDEIQELQKKSSKYDIIFIEYEKILHFIKNISYSSPEIIPQCLKFEEILNENLKNQFNYKKEVSFNNNYNSDYVKSIFLQFLTEKDIQNSPIKELYSLFCATIEINKHLYEQLFSSNQKIQYNNKELYNKINEKDEKIKELLLEKEQIQKELNLYLPEHNGTIKDGISQINEKSKTFNEKMNYNNIQKYKKKIKLLKNKVINEQDKRIQISLEAKNQIDQAIEILTRTNDSSNNFQYILNLQKENKLLKEKNLEFEKNYNNLLFKNKELTEKLTNFENNQIQNENILNENKIKFNSLIKINKKLKKNLTKILKNEKKTEYNFQNKINNIEINKNKLINELEEKNNKLNLENNDFIEKLNNKNNIDPQIIINSQLKEKNYLMKIEELSKAIDNINQSNSKNLLNLKNQYEEEINLINNKYDEVISYFKNQLSSINKEIFHINISNDDIITSFDYLKENCLNLFIKSQNYEIENKNENIINNNIQKIHNEINELKLKNEQLLIQNKYLEEFNKETNDWRKWSKIIFSQLKGRNIPYPSFLEIKNSIEEGVLAATGVQKVIRNIDLLRREKIIINPYIRFPIKILNRDDVQSLRPITICLIFGKRLLLFKGIIF